jgi:hypothetical protein
VLACEGVSFGFIGDSAVKIAARLTINAVMIRRVIRALRFMIVLLVEGCWLLRGLAACEEAVCDEDADGEQGARDETAGADDERVAREVVLVCQAI